MRSFKHAMTTSFGSICEAGAILTIVNIIRQMAQKKEGDKDNILTCLLRMVLNCILSIIEFLTRFATIRIAITGEAFWEGGREATGLLKRNLLK